MRTIRDTIHDVLMLYEPCLQIRNEAEARMIKKVRGKIADLLADLFKSMVTSTYYNLHRGDAENYLAGGRAEAVANAIRQVSGTPLATEEELRKLFALADELLEKGKEAEVGNSE